VPNATAEMSHHPDKLRAWAEIDLSRLERNLKAIRAVLPDHLKYISVVKADAYGHGSAPVVTRLMRGGADLFAVANLDEAAAVRELGYGWPILILSAILPAEMPDVLAYKVIPTVSSAEELAQLGAIAIAHKTEIPVHVKVDTGMGRLGKWFAGAADLIREAARAPGIRLEGIYTHFSCADSDPDFTAVQRARFFSVLEAVGDSIPDGLLIHADNSAGIQSFPRGGPLNGARIGLFQFGVRPYGGSLIDSVHVEPVLSFRARVGLVKDVPAGTGISYGQTLKLARDTRIAVITAGYGDGIPTSASNRGHIIVRGVPCPILGRVTMDQTIVDASALDHVERGDLATIIGSDGTAAISVEAFSAATGQIPWEAFTSITKRVHRIYRTDTLR